MSAEEVSSRFVVTEYLDDFGLFISNIKFVLDNAGEISRKVVESCGELH